MTRTSVLLSLALWGPGTAMAQGSTAQTQDKPVETFNEIERGFYLGVTAGPWFVLNPPAGPGSSSPFSPGQMAQVEAGLDIGERLSFALFLMGSANRAGSEYTGKSNGLASGDFSAIAPGAVVRANLVGFNDAQDVKRTWVYLRAGAGYMMFSPKPLLLDPELLVFGGSGVEYYTRLRHFSVGLEVSGAFLLPSATVGFAVTPSLRYAF
ncbi:MAG: adventurous gliding motility protein CglE [Myxococcota bacterium]